MRDTIEALKIQIEELPVSETQFTMLGLIEVLGEQQEQIDGLQEQLDGLEQEQAEQGGGQ